MGSNLGKHGAELDDRRDIKSFICTLEERIKSGEQNTNTPFEKQNEKAPNYASEIERCLGHASDSSIKKLYETVLRLVREFEFRDNTIQKLESDNEKIIQEFENYDIQLRKLIQQGVWQEQQILNLQKKIESLEEKFRFVIPVPTSTIKPESGPFLWEVFGEHGVVTNSNPFYSIAKYKFFLIIQEGQLKMNLLKGDHDAELSWPFECESIDGILRNHGDGREIMRLKQETSVHALVHVPRVDEYACSELAATWRLPNDVGMLKIILNF